MNQKRDVSTMTAQLDACEDPAEEVGVEASGGAAADTATPHKRRSRKMTDRVVSNLDGAGPVSNILNNLLPFWLGFLIITVCAYVVLLYT